MAGWKQNPKGMTLEQLKVYKKELEDGGHDGGKEYDKVINLIKTLQPNKYSDKDVSGAFSKLSSGVTETGGWTEQNAENIFNATGKYPNLSTGEEGGNKLATLSNLSTGVLSGVNSEIAALQKQLAARQDAVNKATANINDNPWYSEATRVGKIAKLNDQSADDIANLNNQIALKQQQQQSQLAQYQWQQEFNLKQNEANKPAIQTVTNANGDLIGYDSATGKIVYTVPGVSKPASNFDISNFWNTLNSNTSGNISSLWD